jgi:hypothetical protein
MSDTIENIRKELAKKERSVEDLIRYIGTRNDENPNYSLLLGAGCSITSGVRSAVQLIKEWELDIYKSVKGSAPCNQDELEHFYKAESWYNDRNPYSSLFEKKFDLARQRRMFIEKEVRDKMPSIGYSYLIKLVENNYFKTLFTTNFDDLLNEAFYQYSSQRPLVCAHDSAISSITVTSKRPKIIKLHGDYLFDDIKSTLGETESLEENIKKKFVEFAKDYGLILVGYGGNDRSIVDMLTYLLKSEDYFKHGIYWCLREDSIVNDDLKKMFWKDRVYFVVIDGFDELMAEVNSILNEGILPIDNGILNESKIKLIENLTQNEKLKDTKSDIIKKDCMRLLNTRNKSIIDDFFKYLDGKLDDNIEEKHKGFIKDENRKELNESDKRTFYQIQQLLFNKEYEVALDKINTVLNDKKINNNLKIKLLEHKADILEKDLIDHKEQIIFIYNELIEIDDKNIQYYLRLINITDNYDKKIQYIDEIIKKKPFTALLYYNKARIIFERYSELYKKDEIGYKIDDILTILDKSIIINPNIENKAWPLKYTLLKEKYTTSKDDLILEIEVILEKLKDQNKYHPYYVNEYANLCKIKGEDKSAIFKYITSTIDELKDLGELNYIESIEFKLLDLYAESNEKELLDKRIAYIEETYNVDEDFYYLKANYYFDKFNRLDEAIRILESIKGKDDRIYKRLGNYYLYKNNVEKAEEISLKCYKSFFFEGSILEKKKDYAALKLLLDEKIKQDEYNIDYIIQYSYLLLQEKDYKGAENFIFKYLNGSDYSDSVLLINYYLAESKLNKKVADKINEKFINYKGERSHIEMAAAYAIISNEKEMLSSLKKAINKDNYYRYTVKDWPVFENYKENAKFLEIFEK